MAELRTPVIPKLRIGISQRHCPAETGFFARDMLDSGWSTWISSRWLGAQFVSIPNFEDPSYFLPYVSDWGLNAYILSGGGDAKLSASRVAIETVLLDHAQQRQLPVLGVCRGMQALHLRSGGELMNIPGHVGHCHLVQMEEQEMVVNSWHEFGIRTVTEEWEVLASAKDGSVEAMHHRSLPWLGIMWHPERAFGDIPALWPWLKTSFGLPDPNFEV